jgi:ATP-dependent helicase HrpB
MTGAENLLQLLGAIGERPSGGFQITDLGSRMLTLPLPVRLSRLMIDAHGVGLAHSAATIAALLSEKDISPRRGPAETIGDSDLLQRLDFQSDPRITRARDQLLRLLPQDAIHTPSLGTPGEDRGGGRSAFIVQRSAFPNRPRPNPPPEYQGREQEPQLLKLLLLAYPDRVVRRRSTDPNAGIMVGGIGVRLAVESVVRLGEFYIAVDVQADERSRKSEALVRIASRIERTWLDELFQNFIQSRRTLVFEESRQKIFQRNQTFYRDLLLSENEESPSDLVAAGLLLGESLRGRAKEFFNADPAAQQWLARLELLRRTMPEHAWPILDESALADLISTAATNRRSVDQLPPPMQLLQTTLAYPLDRLFETHAPSAITVPTGNRIQIDYTAAGGPVLAVRLQELFGLPQTPAICAGRMPLVLHLLGPNYRPVQITNDLASFWTTAYFQVRKDLKARYPKHSWPENPLTAPPQAKGRRSTL